MKVHCPCLRVFRNRNKLDLTITFVGWRLSSTTWVSFLLQSVEILSPVTGSSVFIFCSLLLIYRPLFLQESRKITQFHYVNWPDHDVPSSFDSILDMIALMREYQEHDEVPVCVHCRYIALYFTFMSRQQESRVKRLSHSFRRGSLLALTFQQPTTGPYCCEMCLPGRYMM